VSHRAGDQGDLFVMNADGSGITRLVTRGIVPRPGALHPGWSPDGARLLYVSRVGRAEQAISLIDIAAGSRVRLMTGYAPAWSPDGRRIAFVVARVGDAQIYVTDGAGRHARRLTGGPGTNLLPAWSADGTRIAFLTFRGTTLHVAVMHADGAGVRVLAPVYGDLTTLPMFAWRPK
jgi:TolB protein